MVSMCPIAIFDTATRMPAHATAITTARTRGGMPPGSVHRAAASDRRFHAVPSVAPPPWAAGWVMATRAVYGAVPAYTAGRDAERGLCGAIPVRGDGSIHRSGRVALRCP